VKCYGVHTFAFFCMRMLLIFNLYQICIVEYVRWTYTLCYTYRHFHQESVGRISRILFKTKELSERDNES
jgi:hypothetical protein